MTRYGGPDVMRYADLPDPSPGRGEVLVSVKAASVNPVDYKIRRGDMRIITGARFPKVLGCDFAGVVAGCGPGASGLHPGDAVYGATPLHLRRPGAHAELLRVDARRVRPIPPDLSFVEAASLPVAALTALNGLRRCGDLSGRSVLVNGATGGVGHFAVQIAKARGALVTAACRACNADLARDLGAAAVVDYAAQYPARAAAAYDVVFDAHGGLGFRMAAWILAPGGVYATTLPTPGVLLHLVWRKVAGGRQIVAANMRVRPDDYAALERLVKDGAVRPFVGATFSLAEGAQAFAALENGGARGKIVIRIGTI